MKVCSDGHGEIVFDDADRSKCPVCVLINQIDNLAGDNDDLEAEVDDLKEKLEGMRGGE